MILKYKKSWIIWLLFSALLLGYISCKPRRKSRLKSANDDEKTVQTFESLPDSEKLLIVDLVNIQRLEEALLDLDSLHSNALMAIMSRDENDPPAENEIQYVNQLESKLQILQEAPKALPELALLESLTRSADNHEIRWRAGIALARIAARHAPDTIKMGLGGSPLEKYAQDQVQSGFAPHCEGPEAYHLCNLYIQYLSELSLIFPSILLGDGGLIYLAKGQVAKNFPGTDMAARILSNHLDLVELRALLFNEIRRRRSHGATPSLSSEIPDGNGGHISLLSYLLDSSMALHKKAKSMLFMYTDRNGGVKSETIKNRLVCNVARTDKKLTDAELLNIKACADDPYIKSTVMELNQSLIAFADSVLAFRLYVERQQMINRSPDPNQIRTSPRLWFQSINERIERKEISLESGVFALLTYGPLEMEMPWRALWVNESERLVNKLKDSQSQFSGGALTQLKALEAAAQTTTQMHEEMLETAGLPKTLADPNNEMKLIEGFGMQRNSGINASQQAASLQVQSFLMRFESLEFWLAQLNIEKSRVIAHQARYSKYLSDNEMQANLPSDPTIKTDLQDTIDGSLQTWGMIVCFSYYAGNGQDFKALSPWDQSDWGLPGLGNWNAAVVCNPPAGTTISQNIGDKIVRGRTWNNVVYETVGPALLDAALTSIEIYTMGTLTMATMSLPFVKAGGKKLVNAAAKAAVKKKLARKSAGKAIKAGEFKLAAALPKWIPMRWLIRTVTPSRFIPRLAITARSVPVIAVAVVPISSVTTATRTAMVYAMRNKDVPSMGAVLGIVLSQMTDISNWGMQCLNIWMFRQLDVVSEPLSRALVRLSGKISPTGALGFLANIESAQTLTRVTLNTIDVPTFMFGLTSLQAFATIVGNVSNNRTWHASVDKLYSEYFQTQLLEFGPNALSAASMVHVSYHLQSRSPRNAILEISKSTDER